MTGEPDMPRFSKAGLKPGRGGFGIYGRWILKLKQKDKESYCLFKLIPVVMKAIRFTLSVIRQSWDDVAESIHFLWVVPTIIIVLSIALLSIFGTG